LAQKKKSGNTVAAVAKLCEPFAQQLGLTIWDIRYVKEGSYWYLRIFIDKPEGVTLDDCEAMSRAINDPLDQLDPIDGEYCLEVCSPGIDRELVRPEHFEAFLAKWIEEARRIAAEKAGEKTAEEKYWVFCKLMKILFLLWKRKKENF